MTALAGHKKKGKGNTQGFLGPITGAVKRRKFLTIDIESKDGDSQAKGFTRPFLVGLFDPLTEAYHEFRDEPHLRARPWERRHISPGGCIDKLLSKILTSDYSGYVFYAHNGGNFDYLFILTWLQEHRDEFGFELIPIQSTIQVIRVWRIPEDPKEQPTEKWEFLDSMRLIPMGLAKACDTFIPELKEERGKISHDLDTHEDDPTWSKYLYMDCVALATVMNRLYSLIEDRLGGEVGITTPATSMKLFRRRFIGKNGVPEHIPRYQHWSDCNDYRCKGCAHEWIRLGYYGGRTEIFRFYGTRLHYYDINSSYVFAMRSLMPIGDRYVENGSIDWRRHSSHGGVYSGFCECTVWIPPDCPIPPLPHRDPKTFKLVFPTGRFTGVWSVEELLLLSDPLVGGRIEKVQRTVWFRLMPMFEAMVDELWKLRDRTLAGYEDGLSALAKLLGNGTYGKFAMRQERTTVVFAKPRVPEADCVSCGIPTSERGLCDKHCFLCGSTLKGRQGLCLECEGSKPATGDPDTDVWYQAKNVDAPYIIPHVAAHITALARMKLWRFMKQAITTVKKTDGVIDKVTVAEALRARSVTTSDGRKRLMSTGQILFIDGTKLDTPTSELFQPVVITWITRNGPRWQCGIRYELPRSGRVIEDRIELDPESLTTVGGKLYYLDTDSIITDVLMPSSPALGELKDEYPDSELEYLSVQPKVYMIGKMEEPIDTRNYKVTMKGFPPRIRTRENLDKLRGGATLEWSRLEKVRSLARTGFTRPPQMTQVTKGFRTLYDKRIMLEDGETAPHVLGEEPDDVIVPEAAE